MREIRRTLGPLFCSKVTGYVGSFLSTMEWRCILFPDSTSTSRLYSLFDITALWKSSRQLQLQSQLWRRPSYTCSNVPRLSLMEHQTLLWLDVGVCQSNTDCCVNLLFCLSRCCFISS